MRPGLWQSDDVVDVIWDMVSVVSVMWELGVFLVVIPLHLSLYIVQQIMIHVYWWAFDYDR